MDRDDEGAEYMDIVNEADEIIGRDTRERVHARHEIHRGVHVFVVNAAGELLLQRRAETTRDYPGYWDASAGAGRLRGDLRRGGGAGATRGSSVAPTGEPG